MLKTTSSHIPPPLLQDPWSCAWLLCAESHAPCQRNMDIDKNKPSAPCIVQQQSQIKTEDVATVRSGDLLAKLELEDLDLILIERRLC